MEHPLPGPRLPAIQLQQAVFRHGLLFLGSGTLCFGGLRGVYSTAAATRRPYTQTRAYQEVCSVVAAINEVGFGGFCPSVISYLELRAAFLGGA